MSITNTITGNLITLAQQGRYTEIAHGCNCFHTMGAGIAPQIAKAFPEAEEADNATHYGKRFKLGNLSVGIHKLVDQTFTLKIVNMYTQFDTKGRSEGNADIDYMALASAFRIANGHVKQKKEKGLYNTKQLMGIPMIGAGLAGGHWDAISTIIDLVTPDMDIELVMYKAT